MNIARRKNTNTFEEICHTYFNELQLWKNEEYNEDIVVALVNTIRPKKPKTVEVVDISNVLHFFIENPPSTKRNATIFTKSDFLFRF